MKPMTLSKCPACGNYKSSEFVNSPKDYEYFSAGPSNSSDYRECFSCKSIYQQPMPSEAELLSLYPSDYQVYKKSSKTLNLLERLMNYMVDFIASVERREISRLTQSKDMPILDFGSGDGEFAKGLIKDGFRNIFVYEPAPEKKDYGSDDRSPEIRRFVSIEQIKESGVEFKLIRMNHVIEHLSDPLECLQTLSQVLMNDGVIVGDTPNADHITRNIFRRFWGCLHYPYHTCLFSMNGLSELGQRAGFKNIRISSSPYTTGWSMSIENIIKVLTRSKKRGRLFFYPLLLLCLAPIVFVEGFIPGLHGSCMKFRFDK